jgi:inositol phosphorylceramide glucuronosyltransferase 1
MLCTLNDVAGVLAIAPNAELYANMTKQFDTLPSYTGGDQGFLSSYYR